jgi:hypothetical protein
MPGPSFQFERVDLDAMRGFQGQGFSVGGLRPGIVVIHGPNTVGKSTLALAMELLLWEQLKAPDGTFLNAQVRVAGQVQERARLQERLVARVDGQTVPASAWVSPETRERYRFSLTDLLQQEQTNQPFGDQLRQEMHGGVDFPAHRRDALAAFSRKGGLTAAYDQAQARVEEQSREQGRQESLEAELRALQAEVAALDGQQRAERSLTALDRALDSLETLLDQEAALAPFAQREALLAGLQDHDDARFQDCRKARDDARAREAGLVRQSGQLLEQLAPLNLSAELREEHALETRDLAAALREAERAAADLGTAYTEAESALTDWRQAHPWLTGPGDPLPELSRETLEGARNLARRFEQTQGLLYAVTELADDLGPEETPPAVPPLAAAAALLDQWLDKQRALEALGWIPELRPRWGAGAWLLLGAGGLAGLAAVALPLRAGAPYGAAAAAAALLLLVLGGLGLRARPGLRADPAGLERDLEAIQAQFAALPIPAFVIRAWTPAEAANAARAIREEAARAEGLVWRNEFRARYLKRKATETSKWRMLQEDAARLVFQLKLPDELGEPFGGYLELFVARLQAGQALRARVTAAQSLHYDATEKLVALGARAAAQLQAFQRAPGTDPGAALAVLARDMDTALRLRAERALVQRQLDELRDTARTAPLDSFLAGLGLQEHTFQEAWETRLRWQPLMARYSATRNLAESLLGQEDHWTPELQALADRHGRPLAYRREDLAGIRAGIRDRLGLAREAVARITGNRDDLVRKQLALEALTRGGTLASLILDRDLAAQNLEALRVRELEGRTLALLIDRLERRGADEDLKPQLQRASELFQQFTRYRYELRFLGGRFQAKEGGRTLDLDQLSAGTRIQLLMAVRLAYVEYQEAADGARLPLFMDEVLANSDDERAMAIIDAIRAMAATGRQIFYFTAQRDEVEKWRTLGGADIQVIDLAEVRRLELQRRIPLAGRDWARPPVPEPGAGSLLDYARAAGAHNPALWIPLGQQHAWLAFAEGEQEALHEALQGGLTTLGQVQGYLETRGGAAAEPLLTTIAILEEAQAQLQAARPRPLGAADLEQADIKGFGDKTRLLESFGQCDGDPRRLLALDIPDVGPKKLRHLRDWLQQGGYLVDQERPAEEILAELKGRYASTLEPGAAGWLAVERFVRMAGEAAAVPASGGEPLTIH